MNDHKNSFLEALNLQNQAKTKKSFQNYTFKKKKKKNR